MQFFLKIISKMILKNVKKIMYYELQIISPFCVK